MYCNAMLGYTSSNITLLYGRITKMNLKENNLKGNYIFFRTLLVNLFLYIAILKNCNTIYE